MTEIIDTQYINDYIDDTNNNVLFAWRNAKVDTIYDGLYIDDFDIFGPKKDEYLKLNQWYKLKILPFVTRQTSPYVIVLKSLQDDIVIPQNRQYLLMRFSRTSPTISIHDY